jgi:carboxyl-terminal processing protease
MNRQEVPDPKTFEVDDKLFNEFKNWLEGKNYNYESDTERAIAELIEEAKNDKYYNFLEEEITSVKSEIEAHKAKDIEAFQDEIRQALKEEIMARYHKRQGMIQSSFETDEEVNEAIRVLDDSGFYESLLVSK